MKRRVWKWVVGIVAGLGLAVVGLQWSAHRRADAVFARHDVLVQKVIAAIRARSSSRAPTLEPATPGDGWAAHVAGLDVMKTITNDETELIPTMTSEFEAVLDREQLREIFGKYAQAVEELRKAARSDRFVPVYDYESGLTMDMSNITSAIRASRYLSALATFEHEEYRDSAALEHLAIGIAMGHDTGRRGPIVNHLVMIVCELVQAEAFRELIAEHSFEAADLELFARRLDRLWEGRPTIADSYEVEEATIARTFVIVGTIGDDRGILGSLRGGPERSWRYLFSHRLAYAGALGELEAAFRETRSVYGLAPHLRPAAMEKVSERVLATGNPVIQSIFPALSRVFLRDSVAQMTWTLMRVATAIAWYESEKGRVPEKLDELVPRYLPKVPICPLTGLPLGYREGAVWSAGRNGVDDGGVPGRDNDADADDGDVIWRVTRE